MENAEKKGKSADVLCHQLGLVEVHALFVLTGFIVSLLQEFWVCMGGLCGHNNTFAFEAKVSITYR